MIRKIYNYYKDVILYTLIAILIGVIVGIIDTIFGKTLLFITDLRDHNVVSLVPFLPFAGIAIIFLYKKFSKESIKGMTLVFEVGFGENEKIPFRLIPLAMVCSWITHLFGGSAGREGVAVQIGATVANFIDRKIKIPDNSSIFLITGMAAGFAGLFQTPVAATFFAMEVLVAGSLQYQALLPALTAAYVASYTSHALGLEKFSVTMNDTIHFMPNTIVKFIIIGIIFGIVGGSFAHLLSTSKKYFSKIIINPVIRIFIIGCFLGILLLSLHTGRYSGLGTNLIHASFTTGTIYSYDWLLKFALTILTLSAGFQGGEVTPLFSIGASLGIVLSQLLGLPIMLTAALGYAAVFGGATNTLLAPILIGAEVFGTKYILYFTVVCSLAYVFNGNKTIYSAQKKFNFFD